MIIVEQHGQLVGLVTVKDVLRFIATEHPDDSSWDGRASLDDLVEETWTRTSSALDPVIFWWRRITRR